jgi:sugar phosphate isomerase/epimerase
MHTRTGNFPIGFRRGWGEWQKDASRLAAWAKGAGFAHVDLNEYAAADGAALKDAGVGLGSVDLLQIGKLTQTDGDARKELLERNVSYIKSTAAAGAKVFFTIAPGDASRSRSENYKALVEVFAPIAEAAAAGGAKIAIEGYPGGPPHYAMLCCTPESVRAILKDVNSPGLALNYDPSHLIRLGVDHVRFLKEFLPHVAHVHAKDTELFPEAAYEYGLYQGAIGVKDHGFGQLVWRYTIPGHGVARWTEIFKILAADGYKGLVSIELEDENFNGTEAGDQAGLVHSLAFLRGA